VFGTRRDVYLDGEAFFDVVHDEARPFAGYAGGGVARDVGTKFNVRAYPETHGVEVVVMQGSVSLHRVPQAGIVPVTGVEATTVSDVDSVLLAAADFGRVSVTGRVTTRHGVDVAARLAWLDGRLVFKDTPLRDALADLSRR
jgi:transmembrane sensor